MHARGAGACTKRSPSLIPFKAHTLALATACARGMRVGRGEGGKKYWDGDVQMRLVYQRVSWRSRATTTSSVPVLRRVTWSLRCRLNGST